LALREWLEPDLLHKNKNLFKPSSYMDPFQYRREVKPVGDEMEVRFQFKKTL